MKTTRKGLLKLQKGDVRIGNFVFKEEREHIKVSDINSSATWRISAQTAVGYLLKEALKDKKEKFLQAYSSVLFECIHTVPTPEFMQDLIQLCEMHIAKNPQFYGKDKPSDDPMVDEQILGEEEQLQKEIDKIEQM